MGHADLGPIRPSFNPRPRVECRGSTVASPMRTFCFPRELDEPVGVGALMERHPPREPRSSGPHGSAVGPVPPDEHGARTSSRWALFDEIAK